MSLQPASDKEVIAKRVAQELRDGDRVNLGIGLPTLVAAYLSKCRQVHRARWAHLVERRAGGQ